MTRKGVPYSWEISQPDGNDEGTDISKYSSLGAPESTRILLRCRTIKQTLFLTTVSRNSVRYLVE